MKNLANVDFIYMSYDEEYADEGYKKLLKLIPTAKRVHGVKGIANAWKAAAELSETSHFITMDADTELNEDFSFNAAGFIKVDEHIHVWRSLNPVNGLIYGHGSIHMFPKQLVQDFTNTSVTDFTLNVSPNIKIQEECATITKFNRSPHLTWRSAFREASKLASNTNMYVGTENSWMATEQVTASRLYVWCSIGADVEYGVYSILGARMGALYGFKYKDDPEQLSHIADYDFFNEVQLYIDNLPKYGIHLKEYGFIVGDFTADQSRDLKKLWYSLNHDVVDRLMCKLPDEPDLNY